MGKKKVCVFVVLIRDKGNPEPLVYEHSLTAPSARELARHLAISGRRSSVIRIDITAADIASLRYGSSILQVARRRI